ncbi:MAG TPA: glycosyltransferase family 4 protein [Actinoplanes sp.]|nr:glycosyltransferase family 4 protein [Actinoplanes sp.]
MEIVQIAGFYPPHLGGAELVAERLATGQAAEHDVTVYTSDVGRGTAPRREHTGRLRVFRDRALRLGNTPVVPRLAARLLRHRPRPDVVHVHGGVAAWPELVRLGTRLRGVPYVVHVHLMVRPSSAAGRVLLPLYQRTLYATFLRKAALVICLTSAMRDELVTAYGLPADRVVVVPNGVDTELFRPGPFAERAPDELLFVGRLTEQKNVLAAVDAITLLPPEVTLRIVGDGELRDAVERRIRESGLTNVVLEGRLGPIELAQRYRRATLVLMPSTHEGLPLVLLEAMATGAPVVCSDLPELVESGGDAVLAVRELTAASLAAAASALLADRPRREALSAAAERRAAGYTWPAVVAAVDELYRRVRAGRR